MVGKFIDAFMNIRTGTAPTLPGNGDRLLYQLLQTPQQRNHATATN
jgi:hypothetical protein